jgi:cob(I)alamin adenosyltransferase
MAFFSRKGDDGRSSVFGGKRVYKHEPIFELLGTIDELSATIGLAVSLCENEPEIQLDLQHIQQILSTLMGVIAGAKGRIFDLHESLEWVENKIDFYSKGHENPADFVFPGATTPGAVLDIARTVARRVERVAVQYSLKNRNFNPEILAFLNRLSSLFFVMRLFIDHS